MCQLLVRSGAQLSAKSTWQCTPEDFAQHGNHLEIIEQLRSAKANIARVRAGAGNAFAMAMNDQRSIVQVEWHVMRNSGFFGAVGVKHSFLVVRVASSEEDSHTYILEKAAFLSKAYECEQFANGVYVSHWQDARVKVTEEPIHVLEASDIQTSKGPTVALSMRMLRGIGVDLGPYHAATCNCHHMALKVYNACAKPSAQVADMPNAMWTHVAELFNMVGINVGTVDASVPPVASVAFEIDVGGAQSCAPVADHGGGGLVSTAFGRSESVAATSAGSQSIANTMSECPTMANTTAGFHAMDEAGQTM